MEPLWASRDLPERLAAELLTPMPPRASRAFAPELSYGRHAGPARGDSRSAAVAVVLCWDGVEWSLPLTVRSAGLTHHGGQVSLPGGLIDAGETTRDAASRELHEELGRRPALEWLGELSPLFVFASNSLVTPCVAAVDHRPQWRPNAGEVDRVLKLDLHDLLLADSAPPLEIVRGPLRFSAPQLVVEGHSAWGATAVMLDDLRGRLLRIAHQN